MSDIATQRDALKAKFNKTIEDARRSLAQALRELEEKQREGFVWIDDMPDWLVATMLGEAVDPAVVSPTIPPQNGGRLRMGGRSTKIQLKDPIEAMLAGFRDDQEITSAIVFEKLLNQMPDLRDEDPVKLRARIAATLGKLREEKKIRILREGGGSVPHVYRTIPAG